MCFIGKHTRSLKDFLEVPFPAFEVNKDRCPPPHHLHLLFFSYPLSKYDSVHTLTMGVTADQICLYSSEPLH